MSPEMAKQKIACKGNDIWGIGVIMYEACMEKMGEKKVQELTREERADFINKKYAADIH